MFVDVAGGGQSADHKDAGVSGIWPEKSLK